VAFLKPDFEILAFFWTPLAFFGNKKSWSFFSWKGLTLEKLELHIYYKSLLKRVYNCAECTKCEKYFTVTLKMINFIDKKQTYNSIITRKKMLLKSGIVYRCSWWVLMSILCLVMHILCVYALKLLSDFFCWRQVGNPGEYSALQTRAAV